MIFTFSNKIDVILVLKKEADGYKINGVVADESEITVQDVNTIADKAKEIFDDINNKLNSTAAKFEGIWKQTYTRVVQEVTKNQQPAEQAN